MHGTYISRSPSIISDAVGTHRIPYPSYVSTSRVVTQSGNGRTSPNELHATSHLVEPERESTPLQRAQENLHSPWAFARSAPADRHGLHRTHRHRHYPSLLSLFSKITPGGRPMCGDGQSARHGWGRGGEVSRGWCSCVDSRVGISSFLVWADSVDLLRKRLRAHRNLGQKTPRIYIPDYEATSMRS